MPRQALSSSSLIPLQPPNTAPAETVKPLCCSSGGNTCFFHYLKKKKKVYFKVFNHSRSLANHSCPVLGGSFMLLQPSAVVILSHQPQSWPVVQVADVKAWPQAGEIWVPPLLPGTRVARWWVRKSHGPAFPGTFPFTTSHVWAQATSVLLLPCSQRECGPTVGEVSQGRVPSASPSRSLGEAWLIYSSEWTARWTPQAALSPGMILGETGGDSRTEDNLV